MTHDLFITWAKSHAKAFGLSEAEFETVLSWEPYFTAAGFHEHDLADATAVLVADPAGMMKLAGDARFLGKMPVHLAAIEKLIREAAARQLSAGANGYAAQHGECGVCSGTGFVCVPDLRGVKHGRWVGVRAAGLGVNYATCAVACSCALGRWKQDHQTGKTRVERQRQMGLERYEHENPDWREHLAGRTRELLARERIKNPTRFDADLAATLKRFGREAKT